MGVAGAKFKSMDDNCGEWVECMGVAGGCGAYGVICSPQQLWRPSAGFSTK